MFVCGRDLISNLWSSRPAIFSLQTSDRQWQGWQALSEILQKLWPLYRGYPTLKSAKSITLDSCSGVRKSNARGLTFKDADSSWSLQCCLRVGRRALPSACIFQRREIRTSYACIHPPMVISTSEARLHMADRGLNLH